MTSFGLGFSGIVLLPLDLTLSTSNITSDEETTNATYLPWMITYWSSWILAFVVLPMTRKCLLSGHFTVYTRFSDAIQTSIRNYVIMIGLLFLAILILAIRLHKWDVVPILMAIGNTYGLLLVALLLGYGLVDLPRQMYRMAFPQKELRRTQILANAADEALFEAVWELQDVEDDIDQTLSKVQHTMIDEEDNNGLLMASSAVLKIEEDSDMNTTSSPTKESSSYYQYCIQKLVHRRNATATLEAEMQSRRMKRTDRFRQRENNDDPISRNTNKNDNKQEQDTILPTISELAQLHARIKAAQVKLVSAEQSWTECVEHSKLYEAMIDGNEELLTTAENSSFFAKIKNKFFIVWITRILRPFSMVSSVIFATLSIMVLWSEATMGLPWNLSPFAFILSMTAGGNDTSNNKGILFAMVALIPLLYMSACVYTSLFKMSFFGPNCLRGYKQSSGAALIFNAQYLIRMQFPLGYNYLLMLKYHTSDTNCSFAAIMKHMSTVPFFGTSFSVYFPLVITCLAGFTICNGYPRLLNFLGMEHEDAILLGDQETLDGKVSEGELLLRRHAQRASDVDSRAPRRASAKTNTSTYTAAHRSSSSQIV
eukprot:CAMPEP_0172418942 /NCGR_PEP_ID=MMETSP1064-20121228/5380_1 /TAXON_ID=202472 /ORGANISM="Aulacoseira subarctica , Strain CCAP 1002/5" /LENGTH=596 /DNA_ID=CAMNT_0013158121 /DNA_START=78 /DNA_END=1868 /DNA_ORIENTATION=-